MSHFSRIFSLVDIINTTYRELCNQTTSSMIFNSSQSNSLRHVTLCYELSRKVAVDLLAAPSSQAFVDRLFSVSGMVSHGRRNRLEKPLEMRVMFCIECSEIE